MDVSHLNPYLTCCTVSTIQAQPDPTLNIRTRQGNIGLLCQYRFCFQSNDFSQVAVPISVRYSSTRRLGLIARLTSGSQSIATLFPFLSDCQYLTSLPTLLCYITFILNTCFDKHHTAREPGAPMLNWLIATIQRHLPTHAHTQTLA